MANETKVVISGDTARAVSALNTLENKLDSTTKHMFDMSSMAGTLAGAITITAFAGFVKSSIDAQDALYQMSLRTGTLVEDLAGLKFAADQNDTSLDAVADSAKKLSVNLAAQPEIFAKFGVTAKDSTGALIQLADVFAAMPDGVEKNAMAIKLLGKSGEEMIPMLNNGSAALENLIKQGREYNPVTTENALQAAAFSDNLDALKSSGGGLGIILANAVLPELSQITQAMVDTARESGLLDAALVGLGATFNAIFTDDMLTREQQVKKRLKAIKDEINDNNKGTAAGADRWTSKDTLQIEADRLQQELDTLNAAKEKEKKILLERKAFREELAAMKIAPAQAAVYEMAKFGGDDAEIKAAQARVNKLSELQKQYSTLGITTKKSPTKADPNDSSVKSLNDEAFNKQMEALGVSTPMIKVYDMALHGASEKQIALAQAAAETTIAANAQIEAQKQHQKIAEQQHAITGKTIADEFALTNAKNESLAIGLKGDALAQAQLESAKAQENQRLQIKSDGLAAETQKMLDDGILTEQIALDQAHRFELLEQEHQIKLGSIDQKFDEESIARQVKRAALEQTIHAQTIADVYELKSTKDEIAMLALSGDDLVQAQLAQAKAQEDARFRIKSEAMAAETQRMLDDGTLTEQIALDQAHRFELLEQEHQIKLGSIDQKFDEESIARQVKRAALEQTIHAQTIADVYELKSTKDEIAMLALSGDDLVQAQLAQAKAQEDARFRIKSEAMAAETQRMLDDGTLTEQIALDQMRRRELMEEQHQVNLTSLNNKHLTQRQQFEKLSTSSQISTVAGMLAQATAAGATRNKELFEINKAAGIANAIVSTYEGANKALAMGPWGIPVAAVMVAGGMANVAMIAQTKFGGGMPGGGGAGSGIPSLATNLPAVNGGTPPSIGNNTPTPVQVSIYNTGNVLSKDYIEGAVIQQIKDAITNSDVVIIDPRSRQASMLQGAK